MSDPVTPNIGVPIRVLLIDVTGNENEFEHGMSKKLSDDFRSKNIFCDARLVKGLENLPKELAITDSINFNTLILVAHGDRDTEGEDASKVSVMGEETNWHLLSNLPPELKDKLVCLAVCWGSCKDAVDAFMDNQLVFALVAPNDKLFENEVLAFYPAFLDELNRSGPQIRGETVDLCVKNSNHLAKNKMEYKTSFDSVC